jgi:Fe-S cluster assembly ATP-binding protein
MSELIIEDLAARLGDKQILRGVNMHIKSGEVHAVMGPNGSGKSTLAGVITGRPGMTVTGGSVRLDGVELLNLAPYERAQAGLFLIMQYPTEVPGVRVPDMMRAAFEAAGRDTAEVDARIASEAARLEVPDSLLDRPVNVDLSGGEKKRNETLQLGVLAPKFAILDELDSGLDVDAMRLASKRVEQETHESNMGVIAITHYNRLLTELKADWVHVLVNGRIVDYGPAALANEIEATGYDRWVAMGATEVTVGLGGALGSLMTPTPVGVGGDPIADPRA